MPQVRKITITFTYGTVYVYEDVVWFDIINSGQAFKITCSEKDGYRREIVFPMAQIHMIEEHIPV